MIHTFSLGKAVDVRLFFGGGDSRLQMSRLQTPDFQKKFGAPPDSRLQILESVMVVQIFFWKSGVWSPGPRVLQILLEIWSLESGALVLQIVFFKSGVWSPGPGYSRSFLEIWSLESGAPGTDFFCKSGVWSPGPRNSRCFLEIWSLESGPWYSRLFSGNLESGVRGPSTPDFFWKCSV